MNANNFIIAFILLLLIVTVITVFIVFPVLAIFTIVGGLIYYYGIIKTE